jgi:hypothetical protein
MSQQIVISPTGKILLEALAALQQIPTSTIIEKALFTYRDSLEPEDRDTIELFCGRAVKHREALQSNASRSSATTCQPKITYDSSRFCFKRERIEKLEPQEQFRMITPVGVFQMSKAAFYREFPNVVASSSYKAGVYNYPRLPSKAEQFRVREVTVLEVKKQFEKRIRALLQRWREACMAMDWPTTELQTGFEELPTRHPVYTWWIETTLAPECKACIQILLETETDAEEEGGYYSVVNCFPSISFGGMGSDHVRWDAPRINALLDDSQTFEQQFQSLEQIAATTVVNAIELHHRNEN